MTLQELKHRLTELGTSAKKSLGQNFLINENAISRIVLAARDFSAASYFEIGPGPGSLTEELLRISSELKVVELDRDFAEYWRQRGQIVFEQDALEMPWLREFADSKSPICIVSNLPYQISSRIVVEFSLLQNEPRFLVFMFQKEVAQRIKARPQSEHFGLLSVIAQCFWQIEMVIELSSRDFFPPPKVASRVLRFSRRKEFEFLPRLEFLEFVKACFQQRRKLLKSNLKSWLAQRKLDEAVLLDWFTVHKKKITARAEELAIGEFVDLFISLSRHADAGKNKFTV